MARWWRPWWLARRVACCARARVRTGLLLASLVAAARSVSGGFAAGAHRCSGSLSAPAPPLRRLAVAPRYAAGAGRARPGARRRSSAGTTQVKKRPKRPALKGFSVEKVVDDGPPEGYDTVSQVFDIIRYPHPALRRPNAEVTSFDGRLRQLADNLLRTMYEGDADGEIGIGLAAPQVGVNLRLMVYNAERAPESLNRESEEVFVNPRIVGKSDEQCDVIEACLSFPRMDGRVTRPTWVEVEAADLEGRSYRRRIEGTAARVFQHEYDHLEGVLYVDHLSKENRAKVQHVLEKFTDKYAAGGGKEPAL